MKRDAKRISVLECCMDIVQDDCGKWAEDIGKTYAPDLVIFIAKSGFLFAKPIAEKFHCPMVEVTAVRPSENTKDNLARIKDLIPDAFIRMALKSRLNYLYHEKKSERHIDLSLNYQWEVSKNHKKLLIVDDSVDTGYTMNAALKYINRDFPMAEVQTAAYSVIHFSKKRLSIDFIRYEDQIVLTATSRKSEEYAKFIRAYESWKSA